MAETKVSALILAGGRSTRLGEDKVWLMLDGQPLVTRLIRRIAPLVDEVLISTNTPDRFRHLSPHLPLAVRTVADECPGMGPLAGLCAGLQAARHDLVLALAVDLPFVNIRLLRYMLSRAALSDAVVPLVPHKEKGSAWEPLHAVYRQTCLPAMQRCLTAGDRQVIRAFSAITVRSLPPEEVRRFDPGLRSFTNVNTPEDWRLAQMMLAERTESSYLAKQSLRKTEGMYQQRAKVVAPQTP